MGRLHPGYCEHGKCFDPGDESFGLTADECPECYQKRPDVLIDQAIKLARRTLRLLKKARAGHIADTTHTDQEG